MNIKISQIPSYFQKPPQILKKYNSGISSDIFISSEKQEIKKLSFKGNFFKNLFGKPEHIIVHPNDEYQDRYSMEILNGLDYMETRCSSSEVTSIMSPDEFRKILPKLCEENFKATEDNQQSGVYSYDLDYRSTFSNGEESVYDIMSDIAKYSNKYYENTGNNFVFALTDRDTLEGVQHAVRILASEPEKFKRLKFIPSVKLTFAHKAPTSKIKFENSAMIIYGINPFSKNLMSFVENTLEKRKEMIKAFIKEVNNLYPEFTYRVIEFADQNDIQYDKDYTVSNLYWRAREYAETKGDTEIKGLDIIPYEILEDAMDILLSLNEVYLGSQEAHSGFGSDIISDMDEEMNESIRKIFNRFSTHFEDESGKVVSSAENLFDDVIECLKKESVPPVIALASPYYLSHYFEKRGDARFANVVNFIRDLKRKSDDMLLAFESVVPDYDLDSGLTQEQINGFNDYLRKNTLLYEVGGSFAKRNNYQLEEERL